MPEESLILFLMTRKGYAVLSALLAEHRDLLGFVVVGRDKSVQNDYSAEIRELCLKHDLPCFERTDRFEIASRYALAVSWRWLLRLEKTQLIVFHDSLLPKYRGFNPLVSYLINGEKRIGVTALFANAEYDAGDILAQAASEIEYPLKIADAIEIVSQNYVELVQHIANELRHKQELTATPQNESSATFSLWRDEEDYRIDWTLSACEIRRTIDAVGFPYNGATALLDEKKVRIWDAEAMSDVKIENRAVGKILRLENSLPVIVCSDGLLLIKRMTDDETGANLLPLPRFRVRFK